jgi:putative DNA primase/helicase
MTDKLKDGNVASRPDLLGAAIDIARQGTPVFPCSPLTKQPLTAHGFKDATTDTKQVQAWWTNTPDALIGSPTGKISDRLIIDTDSDRAEEELRLLAEQNGVTWPPITYTVATHKGKHFYFRYPGKGDIGCASRSMPDHVDVRAEGGYVIVPPSPHPLGGNYHIIDPSPKAEVPDWLYKLLVDLSSTGKKISIGEVTPLWAWKQYHRQVANLRRAKPGNRNASYNDAVWWASRLRGHQNLDQRSTHRELTQIARSLKLSDSEINATWLSAWCSGQQQLIKILAVHTCTDLGNAERFVLRQGKRVRFVPAYGERGGWHVWNEHRWAPDGKKIVQKLAQETVRAIHLEAASAEDDDIRKSLSRWAIASEQSKLIRSMLEQASPHLSVEPLELDADLELLNLENGTLDLRTGEVREQHPGDLITRQLPVSFDPRALCPLFEAHLKLVLPDDTVRDYFQEMIAYHLSGSTGEQCIHILHGDGENGKSTTVDLFRNLAGDYGWPAPRALFAGGGYDDIAPHQRADLHGRRFVTCSEFKNGDILRVEVMKSLTSGESTELNACFKYSRAFSFRPQAKFLLDTNYLLEVDSPDFGTWRRIRLISFNQIISGKVKKDLHFDKKLWAERSGVLNWIIAGLQRWNARDRTLLVPDAIEKASRHYEKEQDRLEQFIANSCIRDEKSSVELSRLTYAYQDWIKSQGGNRKEILGKHLMKERLAKKGFDVYYEPKQRCERIGGIYLRQLLDDPSVGTV